MRSIIMYWICVLSSQMRQVLKATTARYPILDAGCSNTRIWHRAPSNKRLFIVPRFLLASLLLIVIPIFTLNNLELSAVHAGQIPTVKKVYDVYGKQEMVEISINESDVKVVPGSKGKVYSIDTDDKSESIVASIEVTGNPKNGVVYAKITGKSDTIKIKDGDCVKFFPSQVTGVPMEVPKKKSPKEVGTATFNNTKETRPSFSSNTTPKPKIAAGFYHAIALKSDGTMWTWGLNRRGQLGNGETGKTRTAIYP